MITPATTPPVPAGVKKFNSTAEIEQYLEESAARVPRDSTFSTLVPTMAAGGISNAPQSWGEGAGIAIPAPALPGGTGYSKTNVQVAGVDEPDIVKMTTGISTPSPGRTS